ncbi:MAG: tyrosine--tRNA ligase [Candidatus Saccharibacteria bacterium]|nr:tyrosine--tRNA ligase [Candidatus Saccharibacteria bacterium]
MKLSEELQWRNLIQDTTYIDKTALDRGSIKFYLGVDPSADSMTIGNLAAILLARRMMESGHQAYLLIGGATGLIGDPDGKKDERNLKDRETIEQNKRGIVRQFRRLFTDQKFMIVDNYDWFKDINYVDFLRDIGKHVPMSQMLGRDFVKSRLGDDGSGISYAEFSYVMIQAYDFLHLNRHHGVELEICGADQWGNSVAGVDLIRRIDGGEAHVMSMPLVVNKSTGRKFGKSEDGAIWLDEQKTSVYKFYQFWLNLDDEGVIDYLKTYTMLSKEEIEDIKALHDTNPAARVAQKTLAKETTILVHGQDRYQSVQRVTNVLFGGRDFSSLNEDDLDVLAAEIPTVKLNQSLIETLVSTKMVKSNGEARRLMTAGAVSIDGEKITEDILIGEACLIKKGKNGFILAR